MSEDPMPREAYVRTALQNTNELKRVLTMLRLSEIEMALDIEAASRRRETIIDRLINRYVVLRGEHLRTAMKEKYLK